MPRAGIAHGMLLAPSMSGGAWIDRHRPSMFLGYIRINIIRPGPLNSKLALSPLPIVAGNHHPWRGS
jgi:hypothetical protein